MVRRNSYNGSNSSGSCLLDELKPLEIGKVAWAFAKVRSKMTLMKGQTVLSALVPGCPLKVGLAHVYPITYPA